MAPVRETGGETGRDMGGETGRERRREDARLHPNGNRLTDRGGRCR